MATSTNASASAIQASLNKKLPGFKPAEIKAFAKTIAELQAKGLKVDDAFPQGIVSPDSVTISGNLDPGQLQTLGDLIKLAGSLKNLNVFPRGIPVEPNMMRVQLTLHR